MIQFSLGAKMYGVVMDLNNEPKVKRSTTNTTFPMTDGKSWPTHTRLLQNHPPFLSICSLSAKAMADSGGAEQTPFGHLEGSLPEPSIELGEEGEVEKEAPKEEPTLPFVAYVAIVVLRQVCGALIGALVGYAASPT